MTDSTPTLTDLPRLTQGKVRPELGDYSPELKKLIEHHTELHDKAQQLQADFNRRKRTAIPAARNKDAEALTQAALKGTKDPGRVHEAEAVAELQDAHRIAEGTTRAATRVAHQMKEAIEGDAGTKALEAIEKARNTASESLIEAAEAGLNDLALIEEMEKARSIIEGTRNNTSNLTTIARPTSNPATQPVGGGTFDNDPADTLRFLIDTYAPKVEAKE
jgi:hypothetical protein